MQSLFSVFSESSTDIKQDFKGLFRLPVNSCLTAYLVCLMLMVCRGQTQPLVVYHASPVPPGARAVSLAGAYFADPSDASTVYWNPAALAYVERSTIMISHSQERNINGSNENIVVPFKIRNGESFAIGLTANHTGYIGPTDNAIFQAVQYGYDFAYATEVAPAFSVGANMSVGYAHANVSNLWLVSSRLGIFYTPSAKVSYGVAFSGIGSSFVYESDRTVTTLSKENLPRSIQAGLTMHFPPHLDKTRLTVSLANEKVFGRDGMAYKAGVELVMFKFLALRGGYILEPQLGSARFGAGVRTIRFQLDYAISPDRNTTQLYYVTLGINL